jgi:hypothetical protein
MCKWEKVRKFSTSKLGSNGKSFRHKGLRRTGNAVQSTTIQRSLVHAEL